MVYLQSSIPSLVNKIHKRGRDYEKTISIEYLSRLNERYEAWESVARKLAHEIKNPLTPIQLTIDRIKNKYLTQLSNEDQTNFKDNLGSIV